MEILVLEHGHQPQLGLFGEWARQRRHALRIVEVPELTDWSELQAVDAIVSFGSYASVHASKERWIAEEVRFLRSAHKEGVPVLGICFGAQALAVALGGAVARGPFVEIGWSLFGCRDPELFSPGPWFLWHEDIFSTPPGARELARSPAGPLAFELGQSIGLQFHPEVDEELVHQWIAGAHRRQIELPVDEETLAREVAAGANGAPARASELFNRIEDRWAGARANRVSNREESPTLD
jgi:GMP synthase-like glutamine amidotransferase